MASSIGFTYPVLEPDRNDAIGCVYLSVEGRDARRPRGSWVTAACAELDAVVRRAVSDWFHTANDVCGPP